MAPHSVLLVDDDALSARGLARLLEGDGFAVEVVTDGVSALRRLAQQPLPEVLVTDLLMPGIDGLALARRAREQDRAIPVFFVTSYPELLGGPHDRLHPPALIFPKPVEYLSLLAALQNVVTSLESNGTSGVNAITPASSTRSSGASRSAPTKAVR